MSRLGTGVKVVAKMTALRDDDCPVEIRWLVFHEEPEADAGAYEVLEDGHLVRLDLGRLSDWQKLAALIGPEGG